MPNPLLQGFGNAGRKYAAVLRQQLPELVFGTPAQANRARVVMAQAAAKAELELKAASVQWLQTKPMARAAAVGGKQVAAQTGLAFGGISQTLTQRLAKDLARNLAVASSSPKPFLTKTLREATIYGATILDRSRSELGTKALLDADQDMTRSLLRSAVHQRTYHQATKRLLMDLGLAKGDRVLFMSGRRMEAGAYAKLVVRTRTMEALNEGKAEQLEATGFQYIKTTEHEDVDPLDICSVLQGKVWALHPNDPLGFPQLPAVYGLPIWHPNCRHSFGAWQPKFETQDTIDAELAAHDEDEALLALFDGKISRPKEV